MNKKNLIKSFAIVAMAVLATSCNNSAPKVEEESNAQVNPTELKIGYVEVDSIMTQYQYCKDYSLVLEKKSQNIQATLNQKGQALQAAAANFQQKLQQNAYTQDQARSIQAGLQKQNADLEQLQQRLGGEFQAETDKFNASLRDSIQNYLARYNKDKKYTLILSKSGDNILYANKVHDITAEVIAGLNKAYKKPANLGKTEVKEEKK